MSLRQYLRDRLVFVLVEAATAVFTAFFLSAFSIATHAVVFVILVFAVGNGVVLAHDYLKRNAYYKDVLRVFDGLDQKCLISEMIEPASFSEGIIFYEILRGANKSMNDKIASYRRLSSDYREYLETWVHEIKTPIASARLTLENHPSAVARKVEGDMDRVEGMVSQALFYARSNAVEKDYVIGAHTLKELVEAALRKNARMLIENKMKVETDLLEISVVTDEKWIGFILDQIIGNAVKYRAGESGLLRFWGCQYACGAELCIEDAGIGVPEKDIGRIFEKGFTGENGRKYAKSTGMGLYICKKLCGKLGLSVSAQSRGGLRITLAFPKGNLYRMEEKGE